MTRVTQGTTTSAQNITPFNFDNQTVRVMLRDCDPWFVAADVCEALGLDNITMALKRLDDDEQALISIEGFSRGNDQVNLVSESGLYSLVLGSRKPEAKRFKKWVTAEVLPSIRKTGSYDHARSVVLSPAEMFLQSAQIMVQLDARTTAIEKTQVAIAARLEEVAGGSVWNVCPQNAEPITAIRRRINKSFGLSANIVDEAIRQVPYSIKPAGMVLNDNEHAQGSHYAVYWVKDVTTLFKRFVAECKRETSAFVSHPFISSRFKLIDGTESNHGK